MDTQTRIDTWRRLLDGPLEPWALFEHGTYLALTEPAADGPAGQATAILREFGPVYAGGLAGGFSEFDVGEANDWAVTGHPPDVLTHVVPDEHDRTAGEADIAVGLHARSKRHRDGAGFRVALEDARAVG